MDKQIILLKTLLLSTSQWNTIKHSKDTKRRKKAIGAVIGKGLLYLMIMMYSVLACVGLGEAGIIDVIPGLCTITISIMTFLFTIFKTNGYLFNFKEYDMLMALPLEAKTIAADKFLYMYIKCFAWYESISIAMMIGYGIYARCSILVYPIWIILSAFVPVIPMLLASCIGAVIAKVSSGFKKKNLVQTFLGVIIVLFSFSLNYIIEAVLKYNGLDGTMQGIYEINAKAEGYYFPAKLFAEAVNRLSVTSALLLVGITIVLFNIVFILVGKSYRQINSALKSHAASKSYTITEQKKKSQINTIVYKEYKRLIGSSIYMTNSIIGEIMALIMGVAALIVGFDQIVVLVLKGAPVAAEIVFPSIPIIVYFFIGMVPTTACTPSLEGKNFWILKSSPIDLKVIYQGKMLFNMYYTTPFMLFAVLCMSVSAKLPITTVLIYLLEGVVLCFFSTAWGCVCGIRHMKLEWENEVEVVKQSAAVGIYLLVNMLGTMALGALIVFLGLKFNSNAISLIVTVVVAGLAAICYFRALALGKRT